MNFVRESHVATLLPNGQVLVAGGEGHAVADFLTVVLSSAEVYNPGSGSWSAVNDMNDVRDKPTATLLVNGQVLVAGGTGQLGTQGNLASADLFNSTAGTWTATGQMNYDRTDFTATLLPSGPVLVTGSDSGTAQTAELYSSGSWTLTVPMHYPRLWHTATLLPNGRVLIVGALTLLILRNAIIDSAVS